MFSLAVLTDEMTAPGFRLAGVEVFEVETKAQARRGITELINDQRMGIIAIDEGFADCIDEVLQAKIDRLYRPVVVILPSAAVKAKETKRIYLERMIKKAIGFELKLG